MKYYWCDFIVPVVMKMQKMKIPTIMMELYWVCFYWQEHCLLVHK